MPLGSPHPNRTRSYPLVIPSQRSVSSQYGYVSAAGDRINDRPYFVVPPLGEGIWIELLRRVSGVFFAGHLSDLAELVGIAVFGDGLIGVLEELGVVRQVHNIGDGTRSLDGVRQVLGYPGGYRDWGDRPGVCR